jgi:diguanylate cyclase (GGDEF)-like protein/PAS domain S-box-containing protein
VRQSDGDYRWIDITSRPVLDDSGDVVSRVGRLRDIAAKKEAEEALRQSEQRFRTAMASAPTGMAVVSLDREFVEVNPALCRLLGRSEQWLIGHGLHDVLDPQDDELDHLLRQDLLRGAAQSLTRDHQMVHANGRRVLVEQSVGLLRDPSGQPTGFVSQFADVTEARRARDQLRFLATHDSLTELLNRRELVARVSGILGQTPRTGQNIGILFIDLDRLKPINDTYGHAVGDEVIVTVARRLRDRVRASDVVARFGGDEFVVVLPAVHTAADAERIARVLHEGVRQPISHDGVLIRTTMSVGAVVVAPGSDPDLALRQADEALYAAKRQGRNRTVVYPV